MTKTVWAFSMLLLTHCGTLKEAPTSAATGGGAAVPTTDELRLGSSAPEPSAAPTPVAKPAAEFRTQDEQNSIEVFRQVAASTVFVTQKRIVANYFGATQEIPAGSGTGFVWDKDGHVVTNYHVIKGAQSLTVTLDDQRSFQATIRGVEPRKDIAVLQLTDAPKDLKPIQVKPAVAKLQVGQKTLAIGNPFGLDHTLTTGIVSALGREVQGIGGVTIRDMVQTDAAINPGNSGGPLLDSAGYLIGMNTMIFSRSGSSAGIGFAVPVGVIKRIVPQIIKTGKAEQVGLGVRIDPSQRLERRLGLKGVIVLSVLPNTPAARAGLLGISRGPQGLSLGDVLVAINGKPIDDYDALYNTLDGLKATDTVKVTVLRQGKPQHFDLELIRLD